MESSELTFDRLSAAVETCMRGRSDVARRVRHVMTPAHRIPWQYNLDFEPHIPRVVESGQVINHLSGRCVELSHDLQDYLMRRFKIPSSVVASTYHKLHKFLTANTVDRGEVILDPGLGMYVEFQGIFLGTRDELQAAFLDEDKEWFSGRDKFWTGDSAERSEELFGLIYDY